MIHIENIKKSYNGVAVLHIPALHVEAGENVGLVGNNGAGKTTLLTLMLDLIQPDCGTIALGGVPVAENDAWKRFTFSFIDESFLIGYLTAEEYFHLLGEFRGVSKGEVTEILEKFSEFFAGEVLGGKTYLRDLSKGNQKKAGIIGALIGDPDLIVLDEPFANLDPSSQFRLKKLINTLREDRTVTLVISSHDLTHTVEISDRILALRKGQIERDLYTNPETLAELTNFFHVE